MARSRDYDSPIVQTYDLLEEGKTVKLWFENTAKFMSFRSMLYRYKAKLDEWADITDPDKKLMHLSVTKMEEGEMGLIYQFKFSDQPKGPKFSWKIVEIIDEEPIP